MVWRDRIVLVIEDEPYMRELISTLFRRQGATVYAAESGEEGLRSLYKRRPHLILLDILMPGMSGLQVIKSIRQLTNVPLIMLTAVNENDLVVKSLQAGADDYITKPFRSDELLARAWAIMRRVDDFQATPDAKVYEDGYLFVDLGARIVRVGGRRSNLTATEYALLEYLIRHADHVRTFEQILRNVWGDSYRGSADNVHVFIWQLRRKIERDPKSPEYIISEHSVGYRFESQTGYLPLADTADSDTVTAD
jgi:two-component system KDP operon response regulator KdpE